MVDAALTARLASRIVAGPRSDRVTTTTPLTGAPLAGLPRSTPDDVRVAVHGARAAQRAWGAGGPRKVVERASVLLRFHDLVLQRQSQVLDLIQLESGKARLHAFEEVADVAMVARHYARHGGRLLADRRRPGLLPGFTRVTEVRHPRGVVGIVAPWNYPLTLAISDALPALLAGNAVVLKPDTNTALTALWAAERMAEAGLPDGVLQVVVGDGDVVGTALVDAADYVCFTGSTATGRLVAERAGRRLVGACLELGGKNALYVADDADLDAAAAGAVRGAFSSAGQLCISMERLLLHEAIAEEFLARFLPRVQALRLGVGLDWTADVGSLASARQLERVSAHVDDAVQRGARVLAGGRPRPDVGPFCFEPTVLDSVAPQADCYTQETFGPVVSVLRVTSDEEAVDVANDSEYGLNASVWTRDPARGARIARQLCAGTVNVNEGYVAAWGSVAAPMGGMKASGLGRRHGDEGLTRFTEPQTIAAQRGPLLGLLYDRMAPEQFARTFTAMLRALEAVRLR